jgi:hypothetical protein
MPKRAVELSPIELPKPAKKLGVRQHIKEMKKIKSKLGRLPDFGMSIFVILTIKTKINP